MRLYELQDKLNQLRAQGADDYDQVEINRITETRTVTVDVDSDGVEHELTRAVFTEHNRVRADECRLDRGPRRVVVIEGE